MIDPDDDDNWQGLPFKYPHIFKQIISQVSYNDAINSLKSCGDFYDFIADSSIGVRYTVQDRTLLVTTVAGEIVGSVLPVGEMIRGPLRFTTLDKFAIFNFKTILLRTVPPKDSPILKASQGVCETLKLSLSHFTYNAVEHAVKMLNPKRVVLLIGSRDLVEPDFYEALAGVPSVDVYCSTIKYITGRLRPFLRTHKNVNLFLDDFDYYYFRRLLYGWTSGCLFEDFKRLEVSGRHLGFTYCRQTLVEGRLLRSLGEDSDSMTEAALLDSNSDSGYALLITDPLRMIFITVGTFEEALVELAGEFMRLLPVDLSGIVNQQRPFDAMFAMSHRYIRIGVNKGDGNDDDDDWW